MFREFIAEQFKNYETVKLDVLYPDYTNYLLILLFVIVIVMSSHKEVFDKQGHRFLDIAHTDQLKGIAIFFVVLGHLWVHVSKTKAQVILSGDSVSLFLLLSGFGLTISTKGQKIGLKEFCLKRINRVMLPYWMVTLLIIILDYFILQRVLGVENLLLTLFGINTSLTLQHLDYVRWFVTFILLWYVMFYILFLKLRFAYSAILMLLLAFLMLPLDYYYFHFGWYQFISFPAGCLLAVNYEKILLIYENNKSKFIKLSIAGLIYYFTYQLMLNNQVIKAKFYEVLPNILISYFSEWNSLAIVFSTVVATGWFFERGYSSKVLLFLGKYSYEIFLIHGLFLVKYNPIIIDQGLFVIVFQFSILFLLIIVFSVIAHKINKKLYLNIVNLKL